MSAYKFPNIGHIMFYVSSYFDTCATRYEMPLRSYALLPNCCLIVVTVLSLVSVVVVSSRQHDYLVLFCSSSLCTQIIGHCHEGL